MPAPDTPFLVTENQCFATGVAAHRKGPVCILYCFKNKRWNHNLGAVPRSKFCHLTPPPAGCVLVPFILASVFTRFGDNLYVQPGSHRRKITHELFIFHFVLPFYLRYLPLILNARSLQESLDSFLYLLTNESLPTVKSQKNTLKDNRTCDLTAGRLRPPGHGVQITRMLSTNV